MVRGLERVNTAAIDGGIEFWFGSYLNIYADYLWHWPKAFLDNKALGKIFVPYVGVGGQLAFWQRDHNKFDRNHPRAGLGVRIPVGNEWLPVTARTVLFLLAPWFDPRLTKRLDPFDVIHLF